MRNTKDNTASVNIFEYSKIQALRNNIKTLYWMVFFQSVMLVTAVFVPLLQRYGLTMSQILQTQALFAFVVAITEVPSGYLADLWGRKNTIIIGQGCLAFSFCWMLVANSFTDFLIYEAIIGLGLSLCSGADLALLYDSQTALNNYSNVPSTNHGNHISRLVANEGYAGAVGAVLASILTLRSLDWVLWVQCGVSIIAFGFSLRLIEAPRQISITGHRENLQKVLSIIYDCPLVLWTTATIIVFGLVGLYAFWLYQKYWELQGIPIIWFGYLWAIHSIIRGVSAKYAHSIEKYFGWKIIFTFLALLPLCGFLGMGLTGGVIGLLFGLTFPISRGLSMVIFYDALNKRLDADFRATVNSLVSLGMRSIFIITGPLLGFLVDTKGVEISLLVLSVLFLPMLSAALIPLAKNIKLAENHL